MYSLNIELCLNAYFFVEHVFGGAFDRRAVFNKFGKIFLVPNELRDELFCVIEARAVREADTLDNYNRYMRIREYCGGLDGVKPSFDAAATEVLKIKGGALKFAAEIKLKTVSDSPECEVCQGLFNAANLGVTQAMFIVGILSSEGIIVSANSAAGLKHINKAAAWNSIEGVLCALYYDNTQRALNMDRLYALTCGSPDPDLCVLAEAAYGVKHTGKPFDTLLLEKAFAGGKINRALYNAQYARVTHGPLLTAADKERLVLSDNAALIAEACELPLKLKKRLACGAARLGALALDRADERAAVTRMLENSDLCDIYEYRPLCLCSDSDYLLDMYARAIADGVKNAHFVRIEAVDLEPQDFDATKNNIFIHNCDEDSDNIYLLFVRGKVDPNVIDRITEFLSSRRRRHTRLRVPSVTVDLGAILPVCFCDRRGAQSLGAAVNTVRLADIAADERAAATTDLLAKKAEYFGVDGIALDDGAAAALFGMPFDTASQAIDGAVMLRRRGATKLTLTEPDLRAAQDRGTPQTNNYGFGGGYNGNR